MKTNSTGENRCNPAFMTVLITHCPVSIYPQNANLALTLTWGLSQGWTELIAHSPPRPSSFCGEALHSANTCPMLYNVCLHPASVSCHIHTGREETHMRRLVGYRSQQPFHGVQKGEAIRRAFLNIYCERVRTIVPMICNALPLSVLNDRFS